MPIPHSRPGDLEVARPDGLAFVADAVEGDDAAAFHKKPQRTCVQLAYVPQLKQALADRFAERLAVALPVPQFRQTAHHRRVVAGIALLERFEELQHRLHKWLGNRPSHIWRR